MNIESQHEISAWLDGQLPESASQSLLSQIKADTHLRAEVDALTKTDAALREWYAGLQAIESSPAALPIRRASAWGKRVMVGLASLAASLALIIVFSSDIMRQTATAADAIDKTAKSVKKAKGLLVRFKVNLVRPTVLDETKTEEHSAKGEIRFGSMFDERLRFVCEERWNAHEEDPELLRVWGQGSDSQWLMEEQGGATTFQMIQGQFDPDMTWPTSDDGGAVDIQSKRTVESIASLIRSFKRHKVMHWMNQDWRLMGGRGSDSVPWVYQCQLAAAKDGRVTQWTLRLIEGKGLDGIISRIALEETVTDAEGKTVSNYLIEYELELRHEEWQEETFHPRSPTPLSE